MPANLENSAVAPGLEKVSFHSNPKKGNAKECSNYRTIALISHASKVMLKILQARLQQYVNRELSDVQAGFRKGRGTRDQIANIRWIM
ncbi:reverse transcriptase domain-containing protein, partial [Acinetobacter baumannii]|uniref:reverse transcriptase domain-containing protein n=1 Tax=Acinetobacter baumannii TaxID=470 RepID=UPI003AF8986E